MNPNLSRYKSRYAKRNSDRLTEKASKWNIHAQSPSISQRDKQIQNFTQYFQKINFQNITVNSIDLHLKRFKNL